MGPEDEIEVVKTGDGVTLTDGNEEYEIKNVSEGHHKKDETMYEIELDDDMDMMDDDMMEMQDMDEMYGGKKGDESKSHEDYMDEMEDMDEMDHDDG